MGFPTIPHHIYCRAGFQNIQEIYTLQYTRFGQICTIFTGQNFHPKIYKADFEQNCNHKILYFELHYKIFLLRIFFTIRYIIIMYYILPAIISLVMHRMIRWPSKHDNEPSHGRIMASAATYV